MLRISLLGEQSIVDDTTGAVRSRLVAHARARRLPRRPRRLTAVPAAHRGPVLARLHRRAGADQPAPRAAPPAARARWASRASRRDRRGTCAGGTPPPCRVDVRVFDAERRAARAAAADDDRGGRSRTPAPPSPLPRRSPARACYDDWVLEARSELREPVRGAVRPAVPRRGPATRRPGGGARGRPPPDPAAAARGGRLPRPDGAAGRPRRPRRRACAPTTAARRSWSASWASRRTAPRRGHASAAGSADPDGADGRADASRRPVPARPRLVGRAARARRAADAVWQARRGGPPGRRARPRRCRGREDPPRRRARRLARRAGAVRGEHAQCFGDRRDGWRWRRSPTGCAHPAMQVGGGRAGPGLARRGRPAGAPARRRGGTGDAASRAHGRRLAAAPLLRGPRAGAARRRPADAAGARRPAVVRPGDADVPRLLPRARAPTRAAAGGGHAARRRAPTTSPDRPAGSPGCGRPACSPSSPLGPLEVAETARLAEASAAARCRRTTASCCRRPRAASRCYVVEAVRAVGRGDPAARPATSTPCCAAGSSRPAPTAREVAALAAAVGRDVTLDLLAEASDLDADGVVAAVDELWRLRILRERGDGYDFSHDLLRDAAYATDHPAAALAAAPAHRPGPRAAARRRHRTRSRPSSPSSTPAADAPSGPSPTTGGRPTSRRGVFAHAEAIRLHTAALDDRAAPVPGAGPATAASWPSSRRWRRRSTPGTATRRPSCRRVLERSVALAESLGRKDSIADRRWSGCGRRGSSRDGSPTAHEAATRALALVEPELRG